MNQERLQSSFAIPLLIGAVVLLLVTLGVGFGVQATCPNCQGEKEVSSGLDSWWVREHHLPHQTKASFHLCVECTRCRGTGSVPLLTSWEKPPAGMFPY